MMSISPEQFRQLLQYLWECLTIGYPAAPLEQEAIGTERRLCGQN